LTVRVDLDKRDEFGSLARTFNKMAQDLSDSRKELEIINAELAGFAHTVSHDLKGPLTAILIAGLTLREAINNPEQESLEIDELLEIIEADIEKSSNLIDDILSLAEAGQIPEVVSDVDVSEIVDGVLKETAASIKEKGIKVIVGDSLGKVTANSTHIYQIFNNLLSNAIKHNDSDEPTIEVSHLGEDETGGHRYLIKDNGSGIPQEDIDKVFMPFFKGETGGTGIGLSTVEKIIKVYGGDVKAYNDNGACFEFTLRDFRKE
ncbi:MAG: HAMP domain-containing histidine kinase, partial [Actinobacteria bacterium]|nr:HAMP domain-containing histidine kinase [Actinomycetota bacterium]